MWRLYHKKKYIQAEKENGHQVMEILISGKVFLSYEVVLWTSWLSSFNQEIILGCGESKYL